MLKMHHDNLQLCDSSGCLPPGACLRVPLGVFVTNWDLKVLDFFCRSPKWPTFFKLYLCSGVHFGPRKIHASFPYDDSRQDCSSFRTLFFRFIALSDLYLRHWHPNSSSSTLLSYVVLLESKADFLASFFLSEYAL